MADPEQFERMADPEQLERLKRSVAEWNQWRQKHPEVQPDLSWANLSGANLFRANLFRANLFRANLLRANLSRADLSRADLSSMTDLSRADLSNADLSNASLSGADLSNASLSGADLSGADLFRANLSRAYLSGANLSKAYLSGANFTEARLAYTIFAWVDLSNVEGLETARHDGPSTININSVTLPHDDPTRLHFLRGVGFTETQIEYLPSLLTPQPIQYHSLFISYAHQDKIIAERLCTDFRKNDIPTWFAAHELVPGDYYRHKIDEAIHAHDKLVLILSEHSIKSQWVEKEVETALKREELMNMDQQVLFPIRLDNTAMTTNRRWISSLRYHRHIGDFTNWQDEAAYLEAFSTLLRHLKVARL